VNDIEVSFLNLTLKRIAVIMFFFIIAAAYVNAVGIGQYSNEKETLYQPASVKVYKFYLFDSSKIHVSLEGDLAAYATINDSNPDGPARNVEVTITFPEYLEPGVHILYLVATQATGPNAAMGGLASVRTGIRVFSLYPYKHPIFNAVSANDMNINEKGNIGLSITNYGEEMITAASGTITVYDEYNKTIAVLPTDTKSVGPYESQSLNAVLDASMYNLTAGIYTAVGNLTYDDIDMNYTQAAQFIVGELNVNIVDSTKELIVNATNKYHVTLESDWAGDIDNVYARITTPNGDMIKTPNIDLIKPGNGRKAAGQLEAYIETKGLSVGNYSFGITIYYDGQSVTKTLDVNIIDGIPPKIDRPPIVSTDTALMIIGGLIIALVVAYFLIFRKSFSKTTGNNDSRANSSNTNKSNNKAVSDNDIRPPTL